MKILVSACLLGENCKYNGKNNFCQAVKDLEKEHTLIKVCPEVLGGLPVPRDPCEIVNGRAVTKGGVSFDTEFKYGCKLALEIAIMEKIDIAILKSRSPSCGKGQIYDGTFSKHLIEGNGFFAEELLRHNFNVLTEEGCSIFHNFSSSK